MKKLTLLFPVLFIILLLPVTSQAQFRNLQFYSDYNVAVNRFLSASQYLQKDTKIISGSAVGGGIRVLFDATENLRVGFSAGYQLYSVQQDSALERWQWRFWETRYKGNVRDALKSDSTLSAVLQAIQKMDVYPLMLSASYALKLNDNLSLLPTVGVGINFFNRRMYLDEKWSKYYPQSNYTFSYSYQNFAPSKPGNPLSAMVALEAEYIFSELFALSMQAHYTHYFDTNDQFGYSNFPLERSYGVKLGLTVLY